MDTNTLKKKQILPVRKTYEKKIYVKLVAKKLKVRPNASSRLNLMPLECHQQKSLCSNLSGTQVLKCIWIIILL
jgi:hypothetical protein